MNINIWIVIVGVLLFVGIAVAIWQCTTTESYWSKTEYAYTYVDERDKSPSATTDVQTGSENDPYFTVKPNGNYTMKMYRCILGSDWEFLGSIPAGGTSYQDTKAV